MTNNIRWLFFDIGSTLVDESDCCKLRFAEITESTAITPEEFETKVIELSRQNKKGDHAAAQYYGLPVPPWHKEAEKLYPESKRTLRELKSKGYNIGVIANQSHGTAKRLESYGILKYIDIVLASAEEEVAKPDPEIFNRALSRAECHPENAVMIGDRPDNDIAPAKALGMKTVWIKQGYYSYATPIDVSQQADITISSLYELLKIF